MKFFLCLSIFLFAVPKIYGQDLKQIEITETYLNQELKEIFEDLENKYPVNFYFKDEWLPTQPYTFEFNRTPLKSAIAQILQSSSNLTFRFYNNNAVIVGKPDAFKDFSQEYYFDRDIERSNPILDKAGVTGSVVTLGKVSDDSTPRNARITGTISDGDNGELLPGVVLQIMGLNISGSTGADGKFSLSIPKGNYLAKISLIGYEAAYINIKVLNNDTWNLQLLPEAYELDEVIIRETPDDSNIRNLHTGLVKLTAQNIKQLPTFMGEADVVRAILALPGISTVGEGAAGFNVRGGNVDQNLILIDESIIFNASHLLGFFSVFNADAIEEVNLFKGNIPAQYGGRLSSVLDIKSKKGNFETLKGTGGLGIVSSRLTLDGPLVKGKTSMLLSTRASYSDWVLKLIRNEEIRNSSAFFYDFNGRIDHRLKNGSVSVSYYQNYDNFRFSDQYGFSWGSRTASIYWNQVYSPNFSSTFTAAYGNLDNSFFQPGGFDAFRLKSGLTYFKVKQNFSFSLSDNHQVNAGLEGIRYYGKPEILVPEGILSDVINEEVKKDNGQEVGIYLNDEFEINSNLSVSAGIRYSFFNHLGPKQVFIYEEGLPKSTSTITDTLEFTTAKNIKGFNGLEPRLSMKISLSSGSSIKISYNRLYQYIHLISNTTSALPVDIWQVSNTYIPPQRSDNYSLGYFKNLKNNLWETSVEVFYRNIHNLVDYKDLPDLILNPALETELLTGIGKAYGAEVYLKKRAGRANGWLSYTYSRSLRKVAHEFSEEIINSGDWYPANFDQPHNLNLVFNAELNHSNMFSANFTYNTGRPVTAPITSYFVNSVLVPHFSERNQFRIPDYHRLDISYTVKTSIFKRQKYSGSITFSIYNVYARRNAFSVYFKRDGDNPSNAFKFSVLGSAFPAVTYNFSF